MRPDAMNAGVNPGGLKSKIEIRVLICYLLSNASGPVPLEKVKEQLHFGGIANYFETALAISELEENGTIATTQDNGEKLYTSTTQSERVANALGSGLPFSVKEKALALTDNIIKRHKNERNNNVTIVKADLGFNVTCTVLEKDYTVASVTLLVPDEETAVSIKNRFLENPMETLVNATSALTGTVI